MSSRAFAERDMTPPDGPPDGSPDGSPSGHFAIDYDYDFNEDLETDFADGADAVRYAISAARAAAAPYTMEAQARLRNYAVVAALLATCSPTRPSSYSELCVALRGVTGAVAEGRYSELLLAGLQHAFRAVFEKLAETAPGPPLPSTRAANAAAALWNRRLRLVCCAARNVADAHRCFFSESRTAGLQHPLAGLLRGCALEPSSADGLCGLLLGLVRGQREDVLLICHRDGATAGLMSHYRGTPVQAHLLSEQLRCYASCRALLKSHWAPSVITLLCASVENGAQQERAHAIKSLCLLLEGDLRKTFAMMDQASPDLDAVLLMQLVGPTTRCGAMRIMNATLGARLFAFEGQWKSKKMPPAENTPGQAAARAARYGPEGCDAVAAAMLTTPATEAQVTGSTVLGALLRGTPLPADSCARAASALKAGIDVLLCAGDPRAAAHLLETLCFACFAGGDLEHQRLDRDLAQSVRHMRGLLGHDLGGVVADPVFVMKPLASPPAGEECQVCMVAYDTEAHPPVALRCGHLFCIPCIRRWMPTSPSCPVCRDRGVCVTRHLLGAAPPGAAVYRRHLRAADFD